MTLSEQMILVSVIAPLVTGVQAGLRSGGNRGLAVGFVVGIIIAICSFELSRRFFRWASSSTVLVRDGAKWTELSNLVFIGYCLSLLAIAAGAGALTRWVLQIIPA
jgi:hypothetical protein